jgi:hypothetical protein
MSVQWWSSSPVLCFAPLVLHPMVVHQTSLHSYSVVDTIPLRPSPGSSLLCLSQQCFSVSLSTRKWSATRVDFKCDTASGSGSAVLVCQSQYLYYIDDVAIYYSSQRMVRVEHGLQNAINCLSHRTLRNRFTFSALKTHCVHFKWLRGLYPPTNLFLSNGVLPFPPAVMFTLSSWQQTLMESHLQHLCIKCKWSLNVSNILSGWSWSRDQTEMLWLHTRIHSKMDYGSFIYGSSMKSELSILNRAHSIEIHLAAGAFHASPLESLCVWFGELPLILWRNLLLCRYMAKLSTQPHHWPCSAVFHDTHHNRYEMNISIPWTVHVCFSWASWHQLAAYYSLYFSNFTMVSHTSNWKLLTVVTSALMYQWIFAHLCFSGIHDLYWLVVCWRISWMFLCV